MSYHLDSSRAYQAGCDIATTAENPAEAIAMFRSLVMDDSLKSEEPEQVNRILTGLQGLRDSTRRNGEDLYQAVRAILPPISSDLLRKARPSLFEDHF